MLKNLSDTELQKVTGGAQASTFTMASEPKPSMGSWIWHLIHHK